MMAQCSIIFGLQTFAKRTPPGGETSGVRYQGDGQEIATERMNRRPVSAQQ